MILRYLWQRECAITPICFVRFDFPLNKRVPSIDALIACFSNP